MFTEFREFLEKFNVVPIAVGLILALAFQPLVDSLVNLLLSIIGKVGGLDVNFDDWQPSDLPVGAFLTQLVGFVVLAFIVFLLVKSLNRAGARTTLAETPDQALLKEIRDLLAK